MTAHGITHVWGRRATVLLTAAAMGIGVAAMASPGASAAPSKAPTRLDITSIGSTSIAPADALGQPAVLIEKAKPFAVGVAFADGSFPVSTTKDTTVAISATGAALTGVLTAVIPGGEKSTTFPDLVIAGATNNVTLTVSVSDGTKEALALLADTSTPFDVVTSIVEKQVTGNLGRSLVVSATGEDTACVPTPEVQTCVDLVLPKGIGDPSVLFTDGICSASVGCDATRGVLQVLADFGSGYGNRTPATLIYKCDKTLCPGGGVPSYILKGSLDGFGALQSLPPCKSKGVIPAGAEFANGCVDYVQSKRDGSGDVYIYWLVAHDARGSCC